MDALIPEITGARVIPFSLPLHGSALRREGWLLRVEHGRAAGWGEASPLAGFSAESTVEAGRALKEVCERLRGRRIDPTDPLVTPGVDLKLLPPSVRFAVELAMLNLVSELRGIPAARILDPGARSVCQVAALVAGSLDECVERAREVAGNGFSVVKIKVGSADPAADTRRVRAVAERLGAGVAIRLDANRGWTPDQAVRFARSVMDLPIEFLEEPLADPRGLPSLAAETDLPIALDESIVGMDASAIEPFDGLAALVLKPTLLGGLRAALRYASRADEIGVSTVVSATFETGVGLRGLAHLAASLPEIRMPAGLGTSAWFAGDTTTPPFPSDSPLVDLEDCYEVSGSPEIAT